MQVQEQMQIKQLIAPLPLLALAAPALAQRVDNNAVTSADDAFGKSVGDSSIGIYNPGDVRGFSPEDAGNIRLEGLYFDKQGFLTGRLQGGNTIHVGISAQGYPFPAPTGIADFELRKAGAKRIAASAINYGPYGGKSIETDISLPLDGDKLGAAIGVGLYRDHEPWGGTPNFFSVGTTLRYAPRAGIEIIPFWMRVRRTSQETQPLIFTSGAFLPKRAPRGPYLGQPWAVGSGFESNYGVVVRADPLGFDVDFGVFHSGSYDDVGYADLLLKTDAAGNVGQRRIVREQGAQRASTSGELRVARAFVEGPRRHTLIASFRGRSQNRRYGGAVLRDYSASRSDVQQVLPEPVGANGPQTRDRVTQTTYGIGYRGQWPGVGELGFGLQKTQYRKRVTDPALGALPETKDSPFLFSATGALNITPALALYAGYTRGLEESPVAPDEALNRNEAPPAIRTEQKEAGVRWTVAKGVTAVAGVFDIQKPYFNLDTASRFRQIGNVRHRGVELSFAGEVAKGLNVVAGGILLDAKLSGEDVARGAIRDTPIGIIKRRFIASLDYQIPWVPGLSIDSDFDSISSIVANKDPANPLAVPPRAVISLGTRYRFKAGRTPVLVRAEIGNLTNTFGWNVFGSGIFVPNGSRRFSLSIAADI
jgi:iron complex outermembrane recepter protein